MKKLIISALMYVGACVGSEQYQHDQFINASELLVKNDSLQAEPALAEHLTAPEKLKAEGAKFSWLEARSKSLKIVLEYQDVSHEWKRATIGSGFLISADGLFVSAYHVMKYCLQSQKGTTGFLVDRDCSLDNTRVRYRAQNGDREFGVKIISHLTEEESTNGKEFHSPDEIIKQRDFIIGKLKAAPETHFSHWSVKDFVEGHINLKDSRADFEFKPLLPPQWVLVAGYPEDRDFEILSGFLNLADGQNRGYFAIDYDVYPIPYLEKEGISPESKWGMRVENHMSGGAAVDVYGNVLGVVVGGSDNTAAILSIENVLETFFSRESANSGEAPALAVGPNKTALYLKRSPEPVL